MTTKDIQIQAEEALIGFILICNGDAQKELLYETVSNLKIDYFTGEETKKVFKTIMDFWAEDKPVDMLTLSKEFGKDVYNFLQKTSLTTPQTAIQTIKEQFNLNKIQQLAKKIETKTREEGDAQETLKDIEDLLQEFKQGNEKSFVFGIADLMNNWADRKEQELAEEVISFGLPVFDSMDLCMKKGHLITLAARPKNGKTTLALQTALNVSKTKNVLFLSLEMSLNEVTDKLLALTAGISPSITQNFGKEKYKVAAEKYNRNISEGIPELATRNLRVYGGNVTIWKVEELARIENAKKPLDLIVIDQFSFVGTDGKFDRQGNVTAYNYVIERLKLLARELEVPILLLAQLNRQIEARAEKIPQLSDLKDCGKIEEASDLILLMHKDDKKNQAVVSITNRHGASAELNLDWDSKQAKFYCKPQ